MNSHDDLERLEDVLASLEASGHGDSSSWWGTMRLICDLRIAMGLDDEDDVEG